MGLNDDNMKNENPDFFFVNFFIDGKWTKIEVEVSFPCYYYKNKLFLLGVKPQKNELFMMILEKAWAKINGDYHKIEGGSIRNIFELFLGCKCLAFRGGDNNIDDLFNKIKENEKDFGTLSLCGSKY